MSAAHGGGGSVDTYGRGGSVDTHGGGGSVAAYGRGGSVAAGRLGFREYWRGAFLVLLRDLGASFDSGVAWVYTIAFALLANSIFMNEFFLTGNVDMAGFFDVLPLLLSVFLPAISMRVWAEERKSRTVELLLTLPLRTSQAVLGKYLAALSIFELYLVTSLPIPIMLAVLGQPDWGLVVSGYLGLYLLGAFFLAFGCLFSALTREQIVAFVAAALACFLLVLSGEERVVAILDGLFPRLAPGTWLYESVSVLPHYEAFARGVIELSALVYFLSLTALSLVACGLVLARNRT